MNLNPNQTNPATNGVITKCISTASYPLFERGLYGYLNTHHGLVGTDLKNGRETVIAALGPRPDYNDLRQHAITKLPLIGQRKYHQKEPTPAQAADPAFDTNTLELTVDAQKRLDNDQDKYDKELIQYNKTFKELRNHDTDALNFIQSNIGALAMTEIKLSPEYPNWEALPYECVSRSFRFLTMVKAMFSKGNSSEAVDVASNLFKLQQEPDEAHPSAFLERVKDQLPQFTAHFEDAAHPGYVKITRIEVAIIHGGLRLSQPANIAAIRDHLKDNPTTALDKPSELRETIQRAHKSGLYPDEPSTQSSAFVSTSTPNKATVLLGDPNKPHCSNCFKLSKDAACYNNHTHSTCSRTTEFQVQPRGRSTSRAGSPAKPRSRSTSPDQRDINKTLESLQSHIDLQAKRELYQGYLDSPKTLPADGSVTVADCFAFISVNFPQDFNKLFAQDPSNI